jgi:hypothetical protein
VRSEEGKLARLRGMRLLLATVAAWAFALCLCLLSRPAFALETSELEERSVTRVLGPHPDRDAAPDGKRIESVQVVRLPVFDDDDPVPDFFNVFHVQTRERMIRRELLFEQGERYDTERIQETIRNLQLLPQFGVVVVVALKGSEPGQVRVVVIVRDVWSLRLNYQFQGRPDSINYLFVNLSEDNFLGTRTRVGSIFTLQPDRYSLGALFVHPRVAGTKIDSFALGRVFVNLDSGKTEGSAATLSVYRDLIALSDEWAFLAGVGWDIEQTRFFSDRRQVLSEQGIPLAYHTSIVRGGAEVTRSFGQRQKFNLTWGMELNRRKYEAKRSPAVSARDFAAFVRDELPVSDARLSPFLQLEHKTARFLATRDVETLSLQESFSLGQWLAVRAYPALHGVGSSRNLVGTVAWLGYTWPLGSGLARVVGSSSIEAADQARHQASAQGALRVVSPRLGFARLIADSALVSTYRNYLNRKLVLGGDSRPRGYVSATFRGASGFAASLELRTFAVNILSARVGGVAFYDVGGASDQIKDMALHQSVGAGVRILFPQVNRQCFRLDWAAPLTAGRGRLPDRPLPGGVFFTFGQAFDVPKVKLPEILGAETTLLDLSQ